MIYSIYGTYIESELELPNWNDFQVDENSISMKSRRIYLRKEDESIELNDYSFVMHLRDVDVYKDAQNNLLYTLIGLHSIAVIYKETDNTITIFSKEDYSKVSVYYHEELNALLRLVIEIINIYRGIISIHASCVEVDHVGIAFTGISGRGKSTRARAWESAFGAHFISGDRPAIIENPNCIKSYDFLGMPWDGKEGIHKNARIPVKAILEVRRSDTVRIRKMTEKQKYHLLERQCFVPTWDSLGMAYGISKLHRLSKEIPMYRCFCGPNEMAAKKVYDIIFEHPEYILPEDEDFLCDEKYGIFENQNRYAMISKDNPSERIELNGIAALLLKEMQYGICKEDMVMIIQNEYEIDTNSLLNDIESILHELEKKEIVSMIF